MWLYLEPEDQASRQVAQDAIAVLVDKLVAGLACDFVKMIGGAAPWVLLAGRTKPKNAIPFQRVPVTSTAIALREEQNRSSSDGINAILCPASYHGRPHFPN